MSELFDAAELAQFVAGGGLPIRIQAGDNRPVPVGLAEGATGVLTVLAAARLLRSAADGLERRAREEM